MCILWVTLFNLDFYQNKTIENIMKMNNKKDQDDSFFLMLYLNLGFARWYGSSYADALS